MAAGEWATAKLFPARAAEDAVVVVPHCGAAVADLSQPLAEVEQKS